MDATQETPILSNSPFRSPNSMAFIDLTNSHT
jgi:hypothetical protein